jgi:predicted ATPase
LAFLHQLRQEETAALESADQTMTLARRQGYPYRLAVGQVLRGWALARMGQFDEGTRALQEGMNGCAAVGAELDRPYHLGLLAEVHLIAGRPAEAAALNRLRGVAAVHCRQPFEVAEQWLTKAIETAISQSALAMELRSALTLSDLWTELRLGSAGKERLYMLGSRKVSTHRTSARLQAASDY